MGCARLRKWRDTCFGRRRKRAIAQRMGRTGSVCNGFAFLLFDNFFSQIFEAAFAMGAGDLAFFDFSLKGSYSHGRYRLGMWVLQGSNL